MGTSGCFLSLVYHRLLNRLASDPQLCGYMEHIFLRTYYPDPLSMRHAVCCSSCLPYLLGICGQQILKNDLHSALLDIMWLKGIFGCAAYYLFLNKHPKEYVGHNPLAQTAMCLMYILGSVLIIITGFGLYAQQWGWDTGWMTYFGWVTEWLGGPQPVRTFHHLLMYYILIFLCAHLYMSFREDIMAAVLRYPQLSTASATSRNLSSRTRRSKELTPVSNF